MANALTKTNGRRPGLGRPVRAWWRAHDPGVMANETTMLEAMRDLHFVTLAHLMRRMTNKKTPDSVKDMISLATTPKLTAEFRGRFREVDHPPARAGEAGEVSGRDILLQGYAERLKIKAG